MRSPVLQGEAKLNDAPATDLTSSFAYDVENDIRPRHSGGRQSLYASLVGDGVVAFVEGRSQSFRALKCGKYNKGWPKTYFLEASPDRTD